MKKTSYLCTRKTTRTANNGAVVQLVRILACHARGRGFEPRPHRKRGESEMVLLFRFKVLRTTTGPSPLPSPRVAMEIAPLMEHRLTFSQSSKDSIRHKGGEYNVLLMWGQVGCNHPLPLWASEVFRRSTKCVSVPREGRKGPLEKVLNILSCLLRGALSSATQGQISIATRGLAGEGSGGSARSRSIEAAFGLLVTLYYLFAIFNMLISVFYCIFPYICNEYKPITQ